MQVEHDGQRNRFIVRTAAGTADLTYEKPSPGVLDLRHTFVPRDSRGDGIAEALAKYAFGYAHKHDLKVRPTCTFVQKWLEAHPELEERLER